MNEDEINTKAFTECGGQCGNKGYTRSIDIENNEEGRFRRLSKELEEMAQQYGIEFDSIILIFQSVSCSKKHLRLALENKKYTRWSQLDDIAL